MGTVDNKDVITALLGASAALAGLVLVFLGLIVSAYGGFAADTPRAVKRKLRLTALVAGAPFVVSVLSMTLAASWLLAPSSGLFVLAVCLFFASLATLVGSSAWTLRGLLWG